VYPEVARALACENVSVGDEDRTIASVRILGGVHAVATDGSLIGLPSASQRRLLAILALHSPRRLRSEWLADVLEISPGALRTSISRIRATVGSAMLETASTGYALVGDVDAARFCRAVADAADAGDRVRALQFALDQWNGPALDEFLGEEWADGEIARLTEIHAGTSDDLAESLIESRRSADAVARLEAQIAQYPYRDRPRGLLIRALAGAGRQADALRAFQQYRSVLADEFGTDPSPDVVRVERRVATGWDGIESAAPANERAGPRDGSDPTEIPLPRVLVNPVGFVGRVGEMESFASELDLVATSGLRSVTLRGEAGIGKTWLLGAFAQEVVSSARATVTYGRCDETGASLQPFRSILGACVDHAPMQVLTEHVARCGGELLRICPSLSARVATMPAPTESDDATERFLAFEAAADLLVRIASARPLVVILDDLQWAEPTAILLLRHLARSLADAPVLLVLSSRDASDYDSDALRAARAELDRGETRRLDLGGLDRSELDDLIATAGNTAENIAPVRVAAALRAQTAGNPLFASQLIRHWAEVGFDEDTVPPSLRDVVWSRVNSLGDTAIEVLAAASVLGIDFDEDVLFDMLELPERDVIEALDAAARSGLLIDVGSPRRSLRFVHALVANALYADVGSSRRARLHGLAARALEKSVEELPPNVVVQLARHFVLAGQPAEAQRWSTRAGDYALDHLAPAEAAQHYRVALDIAIALERPGAERADLMVRLGDAQHRAGETQALDTLEAGARLARQSDAHDALVRAAFAADHGFMRIDAGAPEYLATVEAALAVTDPADVATYARLRALLARSLMYTPDAARRLAAAHEALELATEHGDPTLLAHVAPPVLDALWAVGSRDLRSRVAARAIRAAEATGDPRLEFDAHRSAFNVAVESADHVVAARSLAGMRAVAHGIAEPRLQWTAAFYEAFDAMMAGRLDDAETIATANLDLGMRIGSPDAFAMFAGQLFVIATFGGRHEELLPIVEQAALDNPELVPFTLAYGIICATIGRTSVARDILSEGLATRFGEIPVDNFWMTSVIGHSILAIELDDAEAAALLLPIIEPFAAEVAFNGVTSQGPIAAYVGKLSSLIGEHDVAEEYLRSALETATVFGWKYHRATTLFSLALARHRRYGSLDEESEAWLRESSELCEEFGFRSWIPRIDALAGVSPR
jgi:DNA-binding SARP family transcriptional activator/tetratricopeptide (TPR) repeat protein